MRECGLWAHDDDVEVSNLVYLVLIPSVWDGERNTGIDLILLPRL